MMLRQSRSVSLLLLIWISAAVMDATAFSTISNGHKRAPPIRNKHERPRRPLSNTQLSLFSTDGVHEMNLLMPLLGTISFAVPSDVLSSNPLTVATPTVAALMTDPTVEAEVLTDMSHVALDMATLFGPATIALRLFAVVGRLMAISADYVPDHAILGEEFAFQMLMLGIASHGLYKSLSPMVASALQSTSFRDGRTYQTLFGPAGVSWSQYKAMAAIAMDWIEVQAGRIVTTDEQGDEEDHYMYWLYSGDVQVTSQGQTIQAISRKASSPRLDQPQSMALLGDIQFVRSLEDKKKKSNKKVSLEKKSLPRLTTKAGPSGATLLRINTAKLTSLMENDEQLAQAIQSLLVTEMQEKLSAMLLFSKTTTSVSPTAFDI